MTEMQWERWARGSGIGFAVLLVVGFTLFGDAPKVDASGSEVATFYGDHGGRILAGAALIAVGFVLFIWFAGAISNALRQAAQGRLAATMLAIAGAIVGLQFVVQAMSASLALNVAEAGDEGVLQALNTFAWSADALDAFLLAAFIAAATVGLRRASIVPRWFGWVGIVAAGIVALRGTNWGSDGFWSPSGGYLYVMLPVGLAWIILTSILLVRATPAVEAAPESPSARPA